MAAPAQNLATVETARPMENHRSAQEVDHNHLGAMVSMLERVLLDPGIPIEKAERVLALYNTERERQAKAEFSVAMSAAQAEMRAVLVDKKNSQTSSKYASYAALDKEIRPIYTRHGFSVTFNTENSGKAELIRIVAFVENRGFERRYEVEMPCDGKGPKGNDVMTKTHAVKSAVTYGKSTLLPMIFNLAVTDKADDDGNAAAGGKQTITDEQVGQLRKALEFVGGDEEKFRKALNIESLADIYVDKFQAALDRVNARGRRQ